MRTYTRAVKAKSIAGVCVSVLEPVGPVLNLCFLLQVYCLYRSPGPVSFAPSPRLTLQLCPVCHHYRSFCVCRSCSPAFSCSFLHFSFASSPSASSSSSSPGSQEGEEEEPGDEGRSEGGKEQRDSGQGTTEEVEAVTKHVLKQVGDDQKDERCQKKKDPSSSGSKQEVEVDDGSIPLMLLAQFSSPAETLRHVQPLKLGRSKFTSLFASTDRRDQALLLTRKRRSSDYGRNFTAGREHWVDEARFLSTVGEDTEGEGGDGGSRSKDSLRGDEGEQSYSDSDGTEEPVSDDDASTTDDWGGRVEVSSSEDGEDSAFPLKPPQLFLSSRRKSQVSYRPSAGLRQRIYRGDKVPPWGACVGKAGFHTVFKQTYRS